MRTLLVGNVCVKYLCKCKCRYFQCNWKRYDCDFDVILWSVVFYLKLSTIYSPIVLRLILHRKLSDCVLGIFAVFKVMDLIPSEKEGEPFEEAMARVRRCIGGGVGQGVGGDNNESDSDLEVVADSISVNLRCPVRIMLLCNTTIFCLYDLCSILRPKKC